MRAILVPLVCSRVLNDRMNDIRGRIRLFGSMIWLSRINIHKSKVWFHSGPGRQRNMYETLNVSLMCSAGQSEMCAWERTRWAAVPTDTAQGRRAGTGRRVRCSRRRRLPDVHRHEARPCLVGEEMLKMAKMWVHFKNRLLDGTLAGLLCITKILWKQVQT